MTKSLRRRFIRFATKGALTLSDRSFFGPLAQFFLKSTNASILALIPFRDAADESFKLCDGCDFSRALPSFDGNRSQPEICHFPDLFAHLLTNVICTGYSSQFLKDDTLITTEARIRQRNRIVCSSEDTGFYDSKHAYFRRRRNYERYRSAVFLSGDCAYNWYHFLIECLSKSSLINELPPQFRDLPIILPPEVQKYGNYSEALRAVLPRHDIITVGREPVLVDKLIVIDDVCVGPANLEPGFWPKVSDYSLHTNTLRRYSLVLRKSLGRSASRNRRSGRLFIMRPGSRRKYNQSELFEIAGDFGFAPFSPECMSVHEQAQTLSEATHIIGASGAAWSNLIFCENSVRGLSWIFPEHSEFCAYSMLAEALGHELDFLAAEPSKRISSTGEAYSADYNVPVQRFEAALDRLCRIE